jgi:hypothetical protein
MWLEIIVGGGIVTFSNVGMYLDKFGKDPRCEWATKIEAEAQKICGRKEDVQLRCDRGDLRIWLHKDAVRSVVRAIKEAEPSIPEGVRGFFQRICYLLEHSDELAVRVADLG